MIALKAINFKLELVFLRIMWVFEPAHMITVRDFQSDWRKCNPIKCSKVNGDGKKHRVIRLDALDQITFCALHSFLVEVQANPGYIHATHA